MTKYLLIKYTFVVDKNTYEGRSLKLVDHFPRGSEDITELEEMVKKDISDCTSLTITQYNEWK